MKTLLKHIILLLILAFSGAGFSQITVTPQANQYIACPNATVNLGVTAQSGVSVYWYSVQTGGTALNSSPSNSYTVTNAAPPQTFWVEPRVGSTVNTRIPIQIALSTHCGDTVPQGCAATGTLIYKEDFGGNNQKDPRVSPIDLIGGRSDLIFNGVAPGSGNYSLIKYYYQATIPFLYNFDHTHLGDTSRGYFMYIDPAPSQMDAILYEYDIVGLCSDIYGMSFTVWMADLQTAYARPKVEMQILDKNTKNVIVTTGVFMFPRQSGPARDPSNPLIWHQYGFDFNLPAGVSDITFRLINKEVNNIGNDWAMDDIEIRLCTPPVTIIVPASSDTTLCLGTSIALKGTYTDDGTFGNTLTYRWEYSLTGDAGNPAAWTTKTTATGTSPLNVTYSIPYVSASDTGYYRLLVGTAASINQPNCRAASAIVRLRLDSTAFMPIVFSDTICQNNAYKNGRFDIPANKLQTAGVFEFRDTIPNPTGCDSIIILNLTVEECCQTELKTVIFKPNAAVGQDANIATSYACTMQGYTQPSEFLNGGNIIEVDVIDWTYTSQGCSKATTRSLLKFDELSTIPANAIIINAKLKLFGMPTSGNYGNSCYPGSPSLYANNCPNKAFIQRVTSTWNEQTVTWNTQPSTDTTNQITIPQTTSQWNWNFADSSANLVTMVQNWVNNPSTNFGFMLRLETEAYYRSILFASSDHPNSALHPELIVTYEVRKSGTTDTTRLNATICKGDIYNKNGFNESASGIYTQNLQKRLGCDSIVILTLNVIEKETHTIDAVICYGDVYQANGFNVSKSGTYYDTLQNRFGCDSIVILNLYVASQDTNQIFDTICEGNVYQKNGFTISDSGTYTKNLKNNFGCDSTVILNLTVKPTPEIEIIAIGDSFCEKDMIVLQIITNGDDFLWSTGSLDNPLTITKAGTYTATAKIENCEKSASYIIEDCPCEVWLPNTFTPNNDHINDSFYPVVYSTLNSFSMYIYDRWGQIIFKTDVYASWDGTVNGRSASAGVYYCVLSYSCANDPSKIHHKQGSITLMR